MSLALHGHHILLIATLAFAAAVLTPNWYTNNDGKKINVFQICTNYSLSQICSWTFNLQSNNSLYNDVKILYPILIASFAIACAGLSLIALLLGSWHIQQRASENSSRCLLVITVLIILFSFLFSCGVWAIMLTTNLQQSFGTSDINLKQLGFSFWINIGSSGLYLYALFIYLVAICKDG